MPYKTQLATALVASLSLSVNAQPLKSKRQSGSNPFSGYQFYPVPQYAQEIEENAIPNLSGDLADAAQYIADNVGTFFWMDTASKVPVMGEYLDNIAELNKNASTPYMGQFVVYDLPDRDCAALASNGEYSIANNGVANYKAYIDAIAEQIQAHPDINIALTVEPDSLANLVTNMNVQKCSNAASAYKECVTYAIKNLNFDNVNMYLDAGHAGWLGWPANVQPAAQLFGQLYSNAGSPAAVRGLATNVANYNAFKISSCPSYTQGNSVCDENGYINEIAPYLSSEGFPTHFIVDTGRNGKQPTGQQAWGDWCNVKGTGFGVRPTTSTGNSYVDAFVWIKPGGEADGTSDSSATRYDAHCGYSDALQPAPEAGTWFEAYFEQLLENANPSF
jgi:cellulose 1,4-beta-cellobiosidase